MKETLKKYIGLSKTISEFSFRNPVFKDIEDFDNIDIYHFHTNKSLKGYYGIEISEYSKVKENRITNLEYTLKPSDLTIINTLGMSDRLKRELELVEENSLKYIIIIGTEKYGVVEEIGKGEGLKKAITDFINSHSWEIVEENKNDGGLTVLKRKETIKEEPIKKRRNKRNGEN